MPAHSVTVSATFSKINYNITYTNDGNGSAILQLIDLQGRVLDRTVLAEGQARVSLPDVAKGMYLLRLNSNNGTKVQKIIVK